MTTVFIAGSIKIKHLDRKFKERIDKIIASGFDVVVGDADGADTAIQTYLFEQGSSNTTAVVYRSGSGPPWLTAAKQCREVANPQRHLRSCSRFTRLLHRERRGHGRSGGLWIDDVGRNQHRHAGQRD